MLRAVQGQIDPASLFDAGLYNPATKSPDVERWLQAEAYEDAGGMSTIMGIMTTIIMTMGTTTIMSMTGTATTTISPPSA